MTLRSPGADERGRLVMRGVHRGYRGREVLRGADLQLTRGTVHWLGGPNGAGKTTLLRVAAGVLAVQAGDVRLDGLHPARDRRAYLRRLGYLSAGDRGLYARLRVRQQLQLQAAIALVAPSRRAAVVEAALVRFDLSELADSRADRLSMGQRQRVRLAVALLHDPDVALLDEPHTSLDHEGLTLLGQVMDEIADRGGTVLWCSPDADLLPLRRDAMSVLRDGQVIAA